MFYGNLPKFGRKVQVGNKVQFGNNVSSALFSIEQSERRVCKNTEWQSQEKGF